jgi:hypothetical protein
VEDSRRTRIGGRSRPRPAVENPRVRDALVTPPSRGAGTLALNKGEEGMRKTLQVQAPRIRRCGNGFAAEGPGFFVWDTDPRAVADAALLLVRGAVPARTPERLLVLQFGEGPRSADPGSLDA